MNRKEFFKFNNNWTENNKLMFLSSDHLRYENGKHVAGPHGGAKRGIKIERNANKELFTVTTYNMEGNHPLWNSNIQMASKPMRVEKRYQNRIVLRGFGHDMFGNSFSDYGLTIYIDKNHIDKCILHMHDRNVDIEYLSNSDSYETQESNQNSDLELIKNFIKSWNNQTMDKKIQIAKKTDELNNIGVEYFNKDDIDKAISYFNEAIKIMPINDDALRNLRSCYNAKKNQEKVNEITQKLNYLKKFG